MAEKFKIDIIYLKQAGSYFKWDHYLAVHSPLALGVAAQFANFTRYDVARPIDDSDSPYHCVSTLFFDSQDEADKLMAAFASPSFAEAIADQTNFTNVEPTLVPSCHYEWSDAHNRVR